MIGVAALLLPRFTTFKFQSKSLQKNTVDYRKMSEQFVGKWNLLESEGFDEYMKEIGISFLTRKMANNLKPQLDIQVNGDHWKITSTSTFKTTVLEFDLNKPFDETTPDGRTLKVHNGVHSTFKFENGKLIQDQKKIKDSDKDSVFERYIDGGKLVVTCESNGVKAKRVYQRDQ
ncbi:Fatty acid-binding protein-like protein 6 [Aphelenchoides besseyi]|nr:Fatty acid-binding protein-like protein 6 [Aphelenchoides besseyi]KAI6237289.1 Fatty acid-binding protein-like protein 6 [Aphelenchoides besseyi]